MRAALPRKKPTRPVRLTGLCADASSVSRKMYAISCGPLPTQISSIVDRIHRGLEICEDFLAVARMRSRESVQSRGAGGVAGAGADAVSLACNSSTFFCASATSCCFAAI